ncbi:tyrosine-type recombinase/integrase [Anaerotignum propionicum]|uniref:Phage integrase family protein n=1 Tax=Anaerotignum propionicum DSM 1682 TaxID=991789 RepID=A0A0X1U6W2_ANAPI|nr:tyrosine-type recombinase/integrase [Anaerotignum propionicum]AMJ40687.1 tyrosine recombinase XerD [Anaerotignum propionicum DSM 1682]SHE90126.1 Phage integrase family protein [[Clostridium] propionicum DSM 1682] [Anaerotignum propionicum DSM 1682]
MIIVSVSPIKSKEKVKNICKYLKLSNERNYILFALGIYSGLRISDILSLKVKDVKGKTHFLVKEKKTKKTQKLLINDELKKELKWYCKDKEPDDYLIRSRQSDKLGKQKPITRDMALKIMKKIADDFDEDNLGCHSMRKTFGYHYYKATGDIATLQKIYNHSTPRETLIYLCIEQDEKDAAVKKFRY